MRCCVLHCPKAQWAWHGDAHSLQANERLSAANLDASGCCQLAIWPPSPAAHADIWTGSTFGRLYYLSRPNGTILAQNGAALCAGLSPQGSWHWVSFSSKAQQLEVEAYYRSQAAGLS